MKKVSNSDNVVVKGNINTLQQFAKLRNVIVHTSLKGDKVIAEPRTETVEEIKFLHNKIVYPEKVIPQFQFEVFGAFEDDFINEILIEMKKQSFSQFPVFNKDFLITELINTNTISRWLSNNLEEDGLLMTENTRVKDFITYIEFKGNYRFISQELSVYQAYNLFIDQIKKKGRNLDALFITKSGKKNEKLLGLITIADIAHIVI